MVDLLITTKIGFRSWNTNPRVKPSSSTHNLWPFFYGQEFSNVTDVRNVCRSIVQLSSERKNKTTFIFMKRSLLVLAELTLAPPLLGPACRWMHEIAWRHGNMLRDWTMATNLVREPLLKGGLTNQQPSRTHFCCFALWDELEKEKQELFNISLYRKICHF